MVIVYLNLGKGWSPIAYMIRLFAELFEAELVIVERSPTRPLDKFLSLLPRRRGSETCLLVAPGPQYLLSLPPIWCRERRFGQIAAWVIDSVWTDYIPRVVRYGGMFDQFFVTTAEDVDAWQALTGRPTTFVPWGSDVLQLGGSASERPVDVLRIGRQPPEWDNDELTERAMRARGLTFRGRTWGPDDLLENQRFVMRLYGESKFLLGFSNTAAPASYTHLTRAYITGRWTDALAAGAIVAGIAPKSLTADRLLWPGATLELEGTGREEGLDTLASAVACWHPRQARTNHAMALQRLDWRWRFAAVASALGESPAPLSADLHLLKQKIAKLGPPVWLPGTDIV